MIRHKLWVQWERRPNAYGLKVKWRVVREGWFLFGFLPLYVKTISASHT